MKERYEKRSVQLPTYIVVFSDFVESLNPSFLHPNGYGEEAVYFHSHKASFFTLYFINANDLQDKRHSQNIHIFYKNTV